MLEIASLLVGIVLSPKMSANKKEGIAVLSPSNAPSSRATVSSPTVLILLKICYKRDQIDVKFLFWILFVTLLETWSHSIA